MQSTHKREIGGLTFEVTEEGFDSGKSLLVDVGKIAGPALVRVLSGAKTVTEAFARPDGSGAADALSGAVETFLRDVTKAKLDEVEERLAKSTRVHFPDNRAPFLNKEQREIVFSGDLRWIRYFGWLRFALEVNLQSFFGLLTGPGLAP